MSNRFIMRLIGFLIVLMTVGTGMADRSQASPAEQPPISTPSMTGSSPDQLAHCTGRWQGSAWVPVQGSLAGGLWNAIYVATYQDPTIAGCTDTYPFLVEEINVHLNSPDGADGWLVFGVIFTADLTNPGCPQPGVVLQDTPWSITLDPGFDGIVSIPMNCCVERPYFAAILSAYEPYEGSADLVTDGLFTPMPCWSYVNTEGSWDDLVDDLSWSNNVLLWSEGSNADPEACDSCATSVWHGSDLWRSDRDGFLIPEDVLVSLPLPADFFGPGSDPFDGVISWSMAPLDTYPPGVFVGYDAIIVRHQAATLPTEGSSEAVEIEILALSLVSTAPITVTYMGGMSEEYWDVQVLLSEVPQPRGTMDLTRECCDGGRFDAVLPILPRFVFTNIDDQREQVLDFGLEMIAPIEHATEGGVWTADMHPLYGFDIAPPLVRVSFGSNPLTPMVWPSSRFLRCESVDDLWFPFPCPSEPPICCGEYTGGYTGNCNCSTDGLMTLNDITMLIDRVYLSKTPLCCEENGNTNGSPDGKMTLADITTLIDHVYITKRPTAECQ
jgi:hypothetical protein